MSGSRNHHRCAASREVQTSGVDRSKPCDVAALALPVIALASALVALPGEAQAAEASRGSVLIEEIVVTATRREESLQDVPLAVSALTAADIQARGLTQFADYINGLPGVFFEDSGPGRSQVRIRGLSVAEGSNIPATVGTYFGEIPTSVQTILSATPNPRLVDIERVEVLRGPQGTLFGANTLTGAVRIIPAAPHMTDLQVHAGARWFSTAHSNDGSYHIEGVLNLPLVDDRFAVRLVGFKDEIAGYVDNVFAGQPAFDYAPVGEAVLGLPAGALPPGTLVSPAIPASSRRDVNDEDTQGGRVAARWQLTERLRIDLGYAVQETTIGSEPEITPAAGEYAQIRSLANLTPLGLAENLELGQLTVSYEWDTVSLLAATGRIQRDVVQNRDISPIAALSLGGLPLPWALLDDSTGEQWTQEIRLQSKGSGPLGWLVGLYYSDHESDFFQTGPDFSCPACLPTFLGQDYTIRGAGGFGGEQRAIFGELTYAFSERWTAGAGARYLEGDVDFNTASWGLLGGARPENDPNVDSGSGSYSELSPSAHVRFRPSDALTLYAQAAKGFRNGVLNSTLPSTCDADLAPLGVKTVTDPDSLWNYELGAKSTWAGGRVHLNAAVYRADWSDILVGVALQCGFSAIINGGNAIGEGVELEFTAQATDAWRFNLAASYNDTEFKDVQPGTGLEKGGRIAGSPRANFSAGAQYDFDVGAQWSGFARADYVYVGDVFVTTAGADINQGAYGTGNLRLGLQRENLSIDLYGRNLADKRGVVSTADPRLGGEERITRPRELGIELRYSYQ